MNDITRQLSVLGKNVEPSKMNVSTIKLAPGDGQGKPFPACTNCSSILDESANILTGVIGSN